MADRELADWGSRANPPVPMIAPSEYWSIPASRESEVASMTSSSDTSYRRSFFGIDLHLQLLIRSPQIATLATPGTRSRRARIFQ